MADPIKVDAMQIIALILAYGIPGAIQIYQTVTKPSFTVEDLEGLRGLVRLPSEYLK
jgi:hypothetical protein